VLKCWRARFLRPQAKRRVAEHQDIHPNAVLQRVQNDIDAFSIKLKSGLTWMPNEFPAGSGVILLACGGDLFGVHEAA